MKKWSQLKSELLKDKVVAEEYKRLTPKYALISKLIFAREKMGLTQADLARKMGTKQSAIARVESGNANPSIDYLSRLTSALGGNLECNPHFI